MNDTLGALRVVANIVDEVALDKPIDWEAYNYEAIRDLAVTHAAETYECVMKSNSNDAEKVVSILGTLSYLIMENAVQWIIIEKHRVEKRDTSKK